MKCFNDQYFQYCQNIQLLIQTYCDFTLNFFFIFQYLNKLNINILYQILKPYLIKLTSIK